MNRRSPARVALGLVALLVSVDAHADAHVPAVQGELTALYESLGAIVGDADATPAAKQARVARELDQRLDYAYMAAAALGDEIQGFSREQFARFAHAYAQFLQDFFVGVVASSETPELKILETREDSEGRVVVTAASRPRKGYVPGSLRIPRSPTRGDTISYAWRKTGAGWRIAGIAFGGVDVSTTFRGQLEAFLAKNDPDALVAEIQRRNAEYRGTNPFAPAAP